MCTDINDVSPVSNLTFVNKLLFSDTSVKVRDQFDSVSISWINIFQFCYTLTHTFFDSATHSHTHNFRFCYTLTHTLIFRFCYTLTHAHIFRFCYTFTHTHIFQFCYTLTHTYVLINYMPQFFLNLTYYFPKPIYTTNMLKKSKENGEIHHLSLWWCTVQTAISYDNNPITFQTIFI